MHIISKGPEIGPFFFVYKKKSSHCPWNLFRRQWDDVLKTSYLVVGLRLDLSRWCADLVIARVRGRSLLRPKLPVIAFGLRRGPRPSEHVPERPTDPLEVLALNER